jgi:hypothetical protein
MSLSEAKLKIDKMNYEEMLRMNRFHPVGSEWFQGEIGDYFLAEMYRKKAELTPAEQVSASKAVGW